MIGLPPGVRISISTKPLDMRKSFDGMSAIISKELQADVFSGHLFVFLNKGGSKVKIFYWDRNGFCCWYKRLERGVFRLPRVEGNSFKVSASELNLILEGIELTDRQRLRSC